MRKLKNNTHRDLYIITTSPEQYEDFDTANEVLDIDEYRGGIVVFDDLLDSNQKAFVTFFTKGNIKI